MATTSNYEDIWTMLKSKHVCKIAAHSSLHKRIIKGVINKKYYDDGYKLQLAENSLQAKLYYKISHSQIVFTLRVINKKEVFHVLTCADL
jgi:hypothetical protein